MTDPWPGYLFTRAECTLSHRGPEGPNEDFGSCTQCGAISWELRPEGQTYGHHLPDCALPNRHERYCVSGGNGHPSAALIRGYWPGDHAALDDNPTS